MSLCDDGVRPRAKPTHSISRCSSRSHGTRCASREAPEVGMRHVVPRQHVLLSVRPQSSTSFRRRAFHCRCWTRTISPQVITSRIRRRNRILPRVNVLDAPANGTQGDPDRSGKSPFGNSLIDSRARKRNLNAHVRKAQQLPQMQV